MAVCDTVAFLVGFLSERWL